MEWAIDTSFVKEGQQSGHWASEYPLEENFNEVLNYDQIMIINNKKDIQKLHDFSIIM